MEARALTLKLVLDELGVEPDITTVTDRKALQKAIYLGQVAGLDLGHRYGWYIRGPYAPSLARDYYALAEAIAEGDDDSPFYELDQVAKDKLAKIKPILQPQGSAGAAQLTISNWLELLASVHFLRSVRNETIEEARSTIAAKKSHIATYFDDAVATLKSASLISN